MSSPDTTALFKQDAESGLFLPPMFRRTVLPYADMGVLNPPTGYWNFSSDFLSAFAVLVAQAADRPRLLAADLLGNLRTSGRLNQVTQTTTLWPAGTTVVKVLDPQILARADAFSVTFGPINAQQTLANLVVADVQPDGTVTVQTPLTVDVPIGAIVAVVPAVNIYFAGNTVQVSSLNPTGTAIGQATVSGVAGPLLNAGVSLTFAAVAGQRFVLKYIMSYSFGNGGATQAFSIFAHDGTSSANPAIFEYAHGILANGVIDRQYSTDIHCRTSVGNGCIIRADGLQANTQILIAAGGTYN